MCSALTWSACANHLSSRRKLQQDPNNTKWTRNTNTFGQKILRAQGWQPGEYLGAKDAPHSELHGAANASYIRVALKDDMKGLGFDKRKEDEVTGLAEFSDLLSRLNGKSEKKIEEEKEKRLEVKMNAYVHSRYGAMRFVRGGLLVGDEMKTDKDKEQDDSSEEEGSEPEKKSKKRKAESLSDEDESAAEDKEVERKKRRKEEKKSKKRSSSEEDTTEDLKSKSKKKDKKSKSKKDKSDSTDEPSKATASSEDVTDRKSSKSKRKASSSPDSSEDDEPKKSKSERKEEKRARKEQKKKDKEEKKRKKAEAKALTESASEISSALPSSSASTPAGSGTSTPRPPNRGHVRSRFLAAKREALTNEKALAKVCLIVLLIFRSGTDLNRFGWLRLDLAYALCFASRSSYTR